MRRRLDTELVRRGLVGSRSRAAEEIRAGHVLVGGSLAQTPARQVAPSESIALTGPEPRFVSRGGEKLAAALERFEVDVTGRRVLDAGASTGGFTDCVLQAGALEVVAVDVGHGQLAWSLRTDPRVHVLERRNLRHVTAADLGGPVDLAVVDLSFISLRRVASAIADCTRPGGDVIALVKPQFEAGRRDVGKGGVVRDPDVHRRVLHEVTTALADAALTPRDVMPSPLRGADGNIEFLWHGRHTNGAGQASADASSWNASAIDAAVRDAHSVPA